MKISLALICILALAGCSAPADTSLSGSAKSSASIKTHAPPDAVSKSKSKATGALSVEKKHHAG